MELIGYVFQEIVNLKISFKFMFTIPWTQTVNHELVSQVSAFFKCQSNLEYLQFVFHKVTHQLDPSIFSLNSKPLSLWFKFICIEFHINWVRFKVFSINFRSCDFLLSKHLIIEKFKVFCCRRSQCIYE
jgi:hypothetical protein